MAVLAVREYERIQCGERFDPEKNHVTASQHSILERFAENYKRQFRVTVLQHGPRRSLVAQNFVGMINLGRDQVEVLPKIEGDTSVVRGNLIKMIAVILNLDLHAGDASLVDEASDSILETLIGLFCKQLWQAVRRGMVRKYETHEENLTVLRGRLMMATQLKLNLARPDRLMCKYDEFSENNHTNQVIKAALRLLQRVARSQANQRSIAELLFCFHDVDDVASSEIRWHHAAANRLNVRYKPILSMARLFIEGRSPDVVSGGSEGFALLFDMNELFESYVGSLARRVFSREGLTVSLQGPRKHLAMHSDGVPAFQLRPDIVVSNAGSTEFIIDTKWKRLTASATREGVASVDAYQMFAYSSRYSAADVVLLYPHHPELGDWRARRASYLLGSRELPGAVPPRTICVSTIDLRDLGTVEDQLRQIFPTFASACSR